MNVHPITMPKDKARAAFEEYRTAVRQRHDDEDQAIMQGYKALAAGNQVINLELVFQDTPLRDDLLPQLAICKANETKCYVQPRDGSMVFYWGNAVDHRWRGMNHAATRSIFTLEHPDAVNGYKMPRNRELPQWQRRNDFFTMVPNVPPRFRPARGLGNLYILWEPETLEPVPRPPGDPMLLRRLGGMLFAVLAVWDLTPLEQAVLAGTRRQ